MNRFGQYPFVRILIPFLIGIISDLIFQMNDSFTLFLFLFLTVIYAADFFTVNIFGRFEFRVWNGIYLMIMLYLAGAFWVSVFDDRKSENHYVHHPGKNVYMVRVMNEPEEKEKSIKIEVKVLAFSRTEEFIALNGNAILYLKKEEASKKIKYGDELLVQTEWKEISAPQNPGEFDYKSYLSHKRIYAQGFVGSSQWKKTIEEGNFIFKSAIESRKKLLKIFNEAGLSGQEYAVASALILGYTDEINQEVLSAYAATGALHVLSVSGLHVAIIFAVFDKLLSFLWRLKNGKYTKAILILLLLWSYAFLTGLSPSVMRSAAMLSFVVIGKMINRNASIYNILCASAFVLLLFDPLLITDVGFQLSYLAVFGIVYLHPKIDSWYTPRYRVVDFIWSVTAVSLAAQIATFPLGLYYFHKFPNYFLLSNLIVIPLGTVILYIGLFAIVFSVVPLLNEVFIFLLKWSVKFLNEAVLWLGNLPNAVTSGIHINAFECLLIYFFLITVIVFFNTKKIIWLKFSMVTVSLLFIVFSIHRFDFKDRELFIIYNVKNQSAADFITNGKYCFYANDKMKDDLNSIRFHIQNNREMNYAFIQDESIIFDYKNYLSNGNLRVCRIDSTFQFFIPREKLEMDVLWMTGMNEIKIRQLEKMFNYRFLVFDSSTDYFYLQKRKQEAKGNKKVYFVNENGAFIIRS